MIFENFNFNLHKADHKEAKNYQQLFKKLEVIFQNNAYETEVFWIKMPNWTETTSPGELTRTNIVFPYCSMQILQEIVMMIRRSENSRVLKEKISAVLTAKNGSQVPYFRNGFILALFMKSSHRQRFLSNLTGTNY